jgi:iron complex outermembrane receptor protein
VTFEPTQGVLFTVDAYQIDISDRIVKSSALTGAQVSAILTPLGFSGLSSAQYFTNAVDTRTRGVDVVLESRQSLGGFGSVRWSAVYAENHSTIKRIKANPTVLNGFGYVLFNGQAQRQLTDSTPRDRLALGADWSFGRWQLHALETRFGKYVEPNSVQSKDWHFSPKWITDLDVSYEALANVTLSVGANNLFNVRPDRQPTEVPVDTVLTSAPGYTLAAYGVPTYGGMIYGTNSPFGLNGGFYYARIGIKF